jgi:hypothetical protein
MHSEKFLREFSVALDFEGKSRLIEYEVSCKGAKVTHVTLRKDYDEKGRLAKEALVLLVQDKGSIDPELVKCVVVVRRLNDLTPLPETCGALLGYVQPSADRFAYYVFDAMVRPQDVRSKASETTSPARASVDSTEPSCLCVFDGATVHDADTDSPSGTFRVAETPDWFESPSEAKAS